MSQVLKKVVMELTERDVENTVRLREKLHTRNNAEAVSAALSITSSLSDMLEDDKELIIRNKKGDIAKIIIPGITQKE